MTFEKAEPYFKTRIGELKKLSRDKNYVNPWIFVCASAFIDYLAKIAYGKDMQRRGYISFISDYLSKINPKYRTFTYKNGKRDLPAQMYHVLRCGILHSFSLIPDQKTKKDNDGRDRSIVLCHAEERDREKWFHLMPFPTEKMTSPNIKDSVLFVAEDFIDDLEKVVDIVFRDASTNLTLRENIEKWVISFPPIQGNI